MKWRFALLVGAAVVVARGETNSPFTVHVNADKVNLRARPEAATEVVSQVHEGEALTVVRSEGEWFGVEAPSNAPVWVKSQFIRGGAVQADKVKLRSGPGISYRDLGTVKRNEAVVACEVHGEWTRVVPPAALVLWISTGCVERVAAEAVPPVEAAPPPRMADKAAAAEAPGEVRSSDLPPGLSLEQLAPGSGQGRPVEYQGMVERLPLAFIRQIQYRLVDTVEGKRVMRCYLQGNDEQMPQLAGRRLVIKGREYSLKGQKFPVVYPELLTPLPP